MLATVRQVRSSSALMLRKLAAWRCAAGEPGGRQGKAPLGRPGAAGAHQDELEERALVHLDEVRVLRLDVLLLHRLGAVFRLLVRSRVELAVLHHLRQDLGGHVGQRHRLVHARVWAPGVNQGSTSEPSGSPSQRSAAQRAHPPACSSPSATCCAQGGPPRSALVTSLRRSSRRTWQPPRPPCMSRRRSSPASRTSPWWQQVGLEVGGGVMVG